MVMKLNILAVTMLSVPLCGGCATLLRGSHQILSFATTPVESRVVLDGNEYISPVSVNVRRKEIHYVEVSKAGYQTVEFTVDPQWDGVSLVGNIILPGGSFGLVVDQVSGADKSFFELAQIRLAPSTRPDEPPLVLNDFKGHLMTDDQVERAVASDREDHAQFFRGEP